MCHPSPTPSHVCILLNGCLYLSLGHIFPYTSLEPHGVHYKTVSVLNTRTFKLGVSRNMTCGYGGVDKNGPHRLICLKTWSSINGTVWKKLGDVALLEVCQGALRFSVFFLCLLLADQDMSSQLSQPTCL